MLSLLSLAYTECTCYIQVNIVNASQIYSAHEDARLRQVLRPCARARARRRALGARPRQRPAPRPQALQRPAARPAAHPLERPLRPAEGARGGRRRAPAGAAAACDRGRLRAHRIRARARGRSSSGSASGGRRSMPEPRPDDIVTADTLLLALRSTFRPEAARDLRAGYELRFGEIVVHARVDRRRARGRRGPARRGRPRPRDRRCASPAR